MAAPPARKAWAAQTDARYDEDQKLEILAFSYGYLTHAAGDMWAHTLVNDFAQGVFPEVGDIVTDAEAATVALRHIIVEGYIGDATPGFDGNDDRTPVPGEVNEDGDPEVSDDATEAITYGAPPDLFLWETFIGRAPDATGALTQPLPGQPTAERGPLQEFFYNLRNELALEAGSNSNIEAAADAFVELVNAIADVVEECSFPPNLIECPIALAVLGFESLQAVLDSTVGLLAGGVEAIVDAYLAAWVEDIDDGLQHWSNIGNAFATGLFDPHARRAYQDETCGETGSGEDSQVRADCEDGVGLGGTFLDVLGESITTADPNLLSMLGAPDFVATGIELVDEALDAIDAVVDVPVPLEEEIADFKQFIEDKLLDAVSDIVGVPVELYAEILKNPAAWLDGPGTPVPLPPPLDIFNEVGLFAAGEHGRLDTIIGFDEPGLTDQHHDLGPDGNHRLDDDAALVISEFAPLENTITTAKLVLLDGDQLNHVLADTLGRDIGTYPSGERTNVMIDSLAGGDPWLQSIDSDHAWRQDGLPRFCDPGSPLCAVHGAAPRLESEPNGGNGHMPIWESCVARPAFRALFTDWENGVEQFPDLGDGLSSDPGSDPNPPTSSAALDPGAAFFHDPVTNRDFVGGDNQFTVTAVDTPTGKAFPQEDLELRYRVTDPNDVVSPWVTATPGVTFGLTGPDGRYVIETQAADPCHTFADDGADMEAEAIQSAEFFLDTTPPECTCDDPPFGSTFDSDDVATVDYEVDDGPIGSGVASFSSEIDGFLTDQEATTPIDDGGAIDMYLFYPSLRTVTVTATDNIGNTGQTGCTFTLSPTSASLLNNLNRAQAEGDVPSTGVFKSLTATLNVAVKKHEAGQHEVEANALLGFADEIEGQIGGGNSGTGIDTVVGNRFIAYAQDIITRGG